MTKLQDLYRGSISEDEFFVRVDATYPGHDHEKIVNVDY